MGQQRESGGALTVRRATDLTSGLSPSRQIISQTWPYFSMIIENKFREKLEPKIREKSAHLRSFAFTKLCFGQKVGAVEPPALPGLRHWPVAQPGSMGPTGPRVPAGRERQGRQSWEGRNCVCVWGVSEDEDRNHLVRHQRPQSLLGVEQG